MQTNASNKKTPFVRKGQTIGPLLENILVDVARHYKTKASLLKEKDSHADLVVCRRLYCYIAWKITNATLREIGAVISKEHSSVSYLIKKADYWVRNGQHEFIDDWFDWLEGTALWGQYEKIR